MSSAPMTDAVIAALLLRFMESLSPTEVASTWSTGNTATPTPPGVETGRPSTTCCGLSPDPPGGGFDGEARRTAGTTGDAWPRGSPAALDRRRPLTDCAYYPRTWHSVQIGT